MIPLYSPIEDRSLRTVEKQSRLKLPPRRRQDGLVISPVTYIELAPAFRPKFAMLIGLQTRERRRNHAPLGGSLEVFHGWVCSAMRAVLTSLRRRQLL
jgi:hypothetical protein